MKRVEGGLRPEVEAEEEERLRAESGGGGGGCGVQAMHRNGFRLICKEWGYWVDGGLFQN